MRRYVPVSLAFVLLLLDAAAPPVAPAQCVAPGDVTALRRSIVEGLRCARLHLDGGSAVPCVATPPPSCAGSAVDDVLTLMTGAGVPAVPAGADERIQLRCQRAVLGAAKRYASKRLGELPRGLRQSRGASAFASVEKLCDRVTPVAVGATSLPSLGGACTASAAGPGPLDGERVARCTRAVLERLLAEATVGVLRPNVVVVLTDDENVASQPFLARVSDLRAHAIDFANAFAPTPVCGPSRAGIFSAQYAHHDGVITNYEAATTFDSSSTLATWLHDAGYATAMIGKYMNFAIDLPAVPPGWDEWQALIGEESGGNGYTDYRISENGVLVQHGGSPREYSTDLLLARGIGFIQQHAQVPFFLMLAPFAPHLPAIPAQRHAGSLRYIVRWRPDNWRELDTSLKPTWVRFMQAATPRDDVEALDTLRSNQLETLLAVDEGFGRLEDTLEKLGLTDNTVLLFTSDHGYHWGEHWWNSKFTQYEESLRVPFIVSYPVRAPEPATRQGMVTNIDIAPTLAELAGATVPPGLDGRSFVAMLDGDATIRDDFLIQDWPALIVPGWEGVRGTRFKYAHTDSSGLTEELYDEVADPGELANLAFDPAYASTLDELRARLAELQGE